MCLVLCRRRGWLRIVKGADRSSSVRAVRGRGWSGPWGIGLREVPVWSAVERVDVRCRFKTGPVEEVRFEGLQGWAVTCPVQSVAQG